MIRMRRSRTLVSILAPALLSALLLSACVVPVARLDPGARAALDRAFSEIERSPRPGLAVVVHQHGQLVYEGYFGLADLEHAVPVTAGTRFHAGSIAKQVTALSVLRLVQEGHIALDEPVRSYLPDFPDFPSATGPITVRQLLHHSNGLRDNLDLLSMAGLPRGAPMDDALLLRVVLDQRELNHDPGSEYSYTNSGYTVLAAIVRAATGDTLPDWSREHLFTPLDLDALQLLDRPDTPIPRLARSYQQAHHQRQPRGAARGSSHPSQWRPAPMNLASAGSGGLAATPRDLARWLDALLDLQGSEPALWQAMTTPGALGDGSPTRHDRAHLYAAGLLLGQYRGLDYMGHDGAVAEYRAAAYVLPGYGLSVVAMLNGEWRPARDIALFAAEVILAAQGVTLEPWQAAAKDSVDIDTALIDAVRGLYAAPQIRPGARLPPVSGIGLLPRNGGLGVNVLGRPLEVAQALSPRRFRTRQWSQLEIELYEDEAGTPVAAPAVKLDSGSGPEQLLHVQCGDEDFLEALQGTYVSAELQSHYRLVYEEGRLLATHPRQPTLWLVCLTPQVFFAVGPTPGERGFSEAELVLDDAGEVTALRLSHGARTRQILFERRAAAPTPTPY